MGLFIRKPISLLQAEASETGKGTLRRVLGPVSLVAFGIGVIVGAGLFSITGTVAANYTGPAIILSFLLASVGCCFAALCYSEFASIIPVSGSAYTYSYATMGELVAWIIGWDLVLEYTVAATTVSISWSRYFVVFLEHVGIFLPPSLTACPWDGGVVNLPAAAIVVVMSLFLIRGVEGSSIVNNIIVALKIGVIIVFVILGWKYVNADNLHPFIPANTGKLGEFGFSGILRGAAVVSFAFLGFDAVSTAAQESRNPRRDMPIGILCSLLVVTVLYAFLTIQVDGSSILDFLRIGAALFLALAEFFLPIPAGTFRLLLTRHRFENRLFCRLEFRVRLHRCLLLLFLCLLGQRQSLLLLRLPAAAGFDIAIQDGQFLFLLRQLPGQFLRRLFLLCRIVHGLLQLCRQFFKFRFFFLKEVARQQEILLLLFLLAFERQQVAPSLGSFPLVLSLFLG